jgi:hypothetical protein
MTQNNDFAKFERIMEIAQQIAATATDEQPPDEWVSGCLLAAIARYQMGKGKKKTFLRLCNTFYKQWRKTQADKSRAD